MRIPEFVPFCRRNPVTPVLIGVMSAILMAQLYVADHSESLFQFLFVAQAKATPGVILAPLSHGAILIHFVPNIGILLLSGWITEVELGTRKFLVFTLITAYLTTYIQVIYSTITTGSAATLGFSGAVYAYPPLFACLGLKNDDYQPGSLRFSMLLTAIVLSIAIPLIITGYLNALSGGLPSAKATHTTGFLIGLGYGVWGYQD